MQAVVGGSAVPAPRPEDQTAEENLLDVGFPWPLSRQTVSHLNDSPMVVAHAIEHVSAEGGHVGVVGWPELSFASIEHMDNVIAVPRPGPEPLGISAVLAEGLDLVVQHNATRLELTPAAARPFLAKVRGGRAAVVLVGVEVPSPSMRLHAQATTYRGIGRGVGRITGVDVEMTLRTKDRRERATLTLGQAERRLRAV